MATGRVPFQGDSAAQVITAVLCDVPRRIDEFDSAIPKALADISAQFLSKEPSERPANAADAASRLRSAAREGEEWFDRKRVTEAIEVVGEGHKPRRLRQAMLAGVIILCVVGYFKGAYVEPPLRERTIPGARYGSSLPAGRTTSVGVLPVSGAADEPEYLLDGLTDGVIGAMGQLRDLRVISRQSAMHYKQTSKSRSAIAEELGVDLLLEVEFDRVGEVARLRASALEARTERLLWSTMVRRPKNEIPFLQEDLSSAVADRLRLQRPPSIGPRDGKVDRIDPTAYEEYLKGRFLVERLERNAFRDAKTHFESAMELDPNFAAAYVGLAEVLLLQAYLFEESRDLLPKFDSTIRRALELNGEIGRAHGLRGDYEKYFRWNWSEAEKEYIKAIELAPNDPRTRRAYWSLLACLGRFAEAQDQLEVAERLDPVNAASPADAAYLALFRGDPSAAMSHVRRALERDPDFAFAHVVLWAVHHHYLGRAPESDRSLGRFLTALGFGDIAEELLRDLQTGSYEDGLARAARSLETRALEERVAVGMGTMLYAAAGDMESAERWILRAYAKRDPELVWLAQNPSWRALRERPAIQRILHEMSLPASFSTPTRTTR
jgi:TolB-like protein/Tfp pilus assembly protein PilF